MRLEMRYTTGYDWTEASARTDNWREAAVRVYNRHLRDPHETPVTHTALVDQIADDYYVVQLGYPSKRGDSATRLTPRIVVRIVS